MTLCTEGGFNACVALDFLANPISGGTNLSIGISNLGSSHTPSLPTALYSLVFSTGASAGPGQDLQVGPVARGSATLSDPTPWSVFDAGDVVFLGSSGQSGIGDCLVSAGNHGWSQIGHTCAGGQVAFNFQSMSALDVSAFTILDIQWAGLGDDPLGDYCGDLNACEVVQDELYSVVPEPESLNLLLAALLSLGACLALRRFRNVRHGAPWWSARIWGIVLLGACDQGADRFAKSDAAADISPATAIVSTITPSFGRVVWTGALASQTYDLTPLDPTAQPEVDICEWRNGACTGPPVATFTTSGNPSGIQIAAGRYEAKWDITSTSMTTRRTYRIRVRSKGNDEGSVLIDAMRGRWALTRAGSLAPLVAATHIPVSFWMGNGRIISSTGGEIVTSKTGARLVVSPGLIQEPGLVQFSDHENNVAIGYATTSVLYSLQLPRISDGATGSLGIQFSHLSVPSDYDVWAMTVIKSQQPIRRDTLWGRLTPTGAERFEASLKAEDVRDIQETLGVASISADFGLVRAKTQSALTSLKAEAIASTNINSSSFYTTGKEVVEHLLITSDCPEIINPQSPMVPCYQRNLRLVANEAAAVAGAVAVVLVHGWDRHIGSGFGYMMQQGCQPTKQVNAKNEVDCSNVPVSAAPLPGERAWKTWITEVLPTGLLHSPVYVFNYQPQYHFLESGKSLAEMIKLRITQKGYAGVVIVGHSMGGLVGRQAARLLGNHVLGVVSLGTPHSGTPLPEILAGQFLLAGVKTNGGQSLLYGLQRDESTPLFAYGGTNDALYYMFKLKFLAYGLLPTDNAVPLCSSVPDSSKNCWENSPGFFPSSPLYEQRYFPGYDHEQIRIGKPNQKANDLFSSVLDDIRSVTFGGVSGLITSPALGPLAGVSVVVLEGATSTSGSGSFLLASLDLPRKSGRVRDKNYAACCNCTSYSAGLT